MSPERTSPLPTPTFYAAIASFLELLGGDIHLVGLTIDVCVIDTNILLADLFDFVATRQPTTLLNVARFGKVHFVISTTVGEEIDDKLQHPPKKLSKLAQRRGVNLVDALSAWRTEYQPRLHCVDPAQLPLVSKRLAALQTRDSDDLPTGQLIELLQPPFVFTKDKDLAAFEVTADDWRTIVTAYEQIAHHELVMVGIQGGGIMVIITGSEILQLLAKAARAAIGMLRHTPPWMLLLFMGMLAVLIGHPTSRHQSLQMLRRVSPRLSHLIRSSAAWLEPLIAQWSIQYAAAGLAKSHIEQERRQVLAEPSEIGLVTTILLAAHRDLTAREITVVMQEHGYQPRTEYPAIAIGRLMGRYPHVFTRQAKGYWRLAAH